MAFIVQEHGKWTVRKGNNFDVLKTFNIRDEAVDYKNDLHMRYEPAPENCGEEAKERYLERATEGLVSA